jgi:hypothetical protein
MALIKNMLGVHLDIRNHALRRPPTGVIFMVLY